jgi:branched-chain amino acid transport system permease protein
MLDLGYVGFFAIGAYTIGMLTSPEGIQRLGYQPVDFWVALPIAVGISVLAGIILGIPVLKMRGDYLAIVTLGFGEIIRLLFLSNALKPVVNGAQGLTRIPPINIGPVVFQDPEILYFLILLAVGVTWFVSRRLRDSRLGRAWMAIREDEDVAEAMGIDLVNTKLLAFATGAAMAGFGGAIFAAKLQSIVPQTFDLLISINALSVIIIGGLGSIPGVFIGALLLIGVPELLREFAEYRLWAYGVLLVLMMLFRPAGFVPSHIHKRE